eukprot:TRINITY_DN6028_c0_g4_i1.p1 TRINITY_DN6028_c0_g4~~TRINITY_DN6028_c0_g4_i1.p1  ORF type:complete len:134 (-),score=22.62 TRINITY_DN6028_c0_g4_i1:65-466(-)
MLLEEYELRVGSLQSDKARLEAALEIAINRRTTNEPGEMDSKALAKEREVEEDVDARLAEELSKRRDAKGLNALFKRQGSGVYMYGSKQVSVRVNNGKISCNLCNKKNSEDRRGDFRVRGVYKDLWANCVRKS